MGRAIHSLLEELIVGDGQNTAEVERCTHAVKQMEAEYLSDQRTRVQEGSAAAAAAAAPPS
jgi:hypothetical protein